MTHRITTTVIVSLVGLTMGLATQTALGAPLPYGGADARVRYRWDLVQSSFNPYADNFEVQFPPFAGDTPVSNLVGPFENLSQSADKNKATFSTNNPSNYIPLNATASFSYTIKGGGSPSFMWWSLGNTLDSGASSALVSLTNLSSPTGDWAGLALDITNNSDSAIVALPYVLAATPSVDPNSGVLDIGGMMADLADQLFTHPDTISFGSLSLPAHTTASIFPIPGFNYGDVLVFGQIIQTAGLPDVTMFLVTGVPEPSCLSLLALGGIMFPRRRRQTGQVRCVAMIQREKNSVLSTRLVSRKLQTSQN